MKNLWIAKNQFKSWIKGEWSHASNDEKWMVRLFCAVTMTIAVTFIFALAYTLSH